MKFKKLLVLAGLALLSQTASANIILHSSVPGADACGSLYGTWTGSGIVKASFITCKYNGTAIVTPALDRTNYLVAVDLKLADGPLCPDHEQITLPGYCENNTLILKTDDPAAELDGTVNDAGTTADMQGYVYVKVSGQPVRADVSDLHLNKKTY